MMNVSTTDYTHLRATQCVQNCSKDFSLVYYVLE